MDRSAPQRRVRGAEREDGVRIDAPIVRGRCRCRAAQAVAVQEAGLLRETDEPIDPLGVRGERRRIRMSWVVFKQMDLRAGDEAHQIVEGRAAVVGERRRAAPEQAVRRVATLGVYEADEEIPLPRVRGDMVSRDDEAAVFVEGGDTVPRRRWRAEHRPHIGILVAHRAGVARTEPGLPDVGNAVQVAVLWNGEQIRLAIDRCPNHRDATAILRCQGEEVSLNAAGYPRFGRRVQHVVGIRIAGIRRGADVRARAGIPGCGQDE